MRGVGDFGRGGADLGRDGDHFLGQPGSEGGASRRGRDGAAGRAVGGRQGAGAARTSDERSSDFRRCLWSMIERSDGGGARAGRSDDRPGDGGGEDSVQTGAELLFTLFRPTAPVAPSDPGRAIAAEGKDRVAGPGPVAAAGNADPAAAADRDGSTLPASPPRSLRVLAASEPSVEDALVSSPFRGPGRALPAPAELDVWAPDAARARKVAARIEEALRADAAPDGPVTIAVPVDPGLDGLSSLTITLTPVGLDVVLDRVQGRAVSDGLAAAAQDLACRLQKRFPRGSVRVLESVTRADAAVDAPLIDVARHQT